jgi:hypothetical protein
MAGTGWDPTRPRRHKPICECPVAYLNVADCGFLGVSVECMHNADRQGCSRYPQCPGSQSRQRFPLPGQRSSDHHLIQVHQCGACMLFTMNESNFADLYDITPKLGTWLILLPKESLHQLQGSDSARSSCVSVQRTHKYRIPTC